MVELLRRGAICGIRSSSRDARGWRVILHGCWDASRRSLGRLYRERLDLRCGDSIPRTVSGPKRAIVGVSMGGYGAIKLGFHHPELFAFVAAISAAVDVPRRPFTIRRLRQARHYDLIFGPSGGRTRRANDPFALARAANPVDAPSFYLSCGDQEGLLAPNREFGELLAQRSLQV